jgi:Uma2 family endonuclease
MITQALQPSSTPLVYPDRDGNPMSDNTLQFRWIQVLFSGIVALYRLAADVFVAGDLLWYPVEGEPKVRTAPDVLVAFGRPKGDRGSYRQWEEDGIAPQVVFEVLSPGNTVTEMIDKFDFYDQYGVEEYYIYDPEKNRLFVYQRHGDVLRRIRQTHGWVSPRLKIRFDLSGPEMVVFGPDGRQFMTYEELMGLFQQAEQRVLEVEQKNVRLAEKLRQLGVDPDTLGGP